MNYHLGDQLEIKIEKIVPNGLGMGFAENLTVFVPLSVKGDLLAVELRQIQGRTAFAAITNILEPSQERVDPVCGFFGTCGGCDFQQMNYQEQLKAKIGILDDCLKRIAHIDYENEIEIVPSPLQTGYRLRTQFHADASEHSIGFFQRQSHKVVDIDECPILSDSMNRSLRSLRERLDTVAEDGVISNIEIASVGDFASVYVETVNEPVNEVSIEANGEKFVFNARSFFQANKAMIEPLMEAVTGDEEGKSAIDFYCGAGLFSIPLARMFERVIGVESSADSISFARKNGELARLPNVRFFEGPVREFFKDPAALPADLVLIDPPRSGVKEKILTKIAALCKKRLIYVSCNPSTLARDLGVLLKNGYQIKNIKALDLFPQTHHVETVVKLDKVA